MPDLAERVRGWIVRPLLNRPGWCAFDLVRWAHFGPRHTDARLSRSKDITECVADAERCGSCYCGKETR